MDLFIAHTNIVTLVGYGVCIGALYLALQQRITQSTAVLVVYSLSLLYVALLTRAQFLVWRGSELMRHAMIQPIPPSIPIYGIFLPVKVCAAHAYGYFCFYAYTRFFLPLLLAILGAGVIVALAFLIRTMLRRIWKSHLTNDQLLTLSPTLFFVVCFLLLYPFVHFFI